MSTAVRVTAFLGLVTGVALFISIAVIAPDDGLDARSAAQGLGVGAIIAAAPMAALISRADPPRVVTLGGAMVLAGMATTPGGNLAGMVMAAAGLAIVLAGASRNPQLSWGLMGLTLLHAIMLAIGMYAGLTAGRGTVIALILTVVVASSNRWLPAPGSWNT